MYWGNSPALDLQEEVDSDGEELRALLVGGCDARHLLKTLARTYRHGAGRRLQLQVQEASVELLARQLLLLAVALEPALGPRHKARLFAELYGNLLLRPAAARYLSAKAAQLALAVSACDDGAGLRRCVPPVSLARLRHRERDQLLDVLEFWAAAGRGIFQPLRHWDDRLRKHLGSRYDSREGVFDWDYHMRLTELQGGGAVGSREYRHWRRTGLAFTWPGDDAEPRHPNCTLASGVVRLCGRLCHHGYLGDVVSGPFAAFGMCCEPEDKDLLKTANGVRVHRSADVMERNLVRIFHELQTGQPYIHNLDADLTGGTTIMELPDVQDCLLVEPQQEMPQLETFSAISTGDAQVTFLPMGTVESRRPFKERQDLVYVSQLMWESLGPAVECAARAGTRVLVETRALIVGPCKEKLHQFGADLEHAAQDCGCSPLTAFDGAKDPVARFTVTSPKS